jgi:hypothetical protein
LPARDTSRDSTQRLIREALHAALPRDVEGVFFDAALRREVITRVLKDDGAVEALGKFARGIVQKGMRKRGVPVSVTLTLMYKMRWHAKVVLRRIATLQGLKQESERRLDELDRIDRLLRRLDSDALDTLHGFGRVDPTLVPPAAFMAVAELRALFQRYGAAVPELRSQLGTTKRTGGGIAKRQLERRPIRLNRMGFTNQRGSDSSCLPDGGRRTWRHPFHSIFAFACWLRSRGGYRTVR